ncbi:hypothetical protein B7R78_0019765 [Ralstonia solanacearum]|nr:hypothetical protein [Ralstonia solanacearum]QOK84526.1 hypothetical protein HF906_20940 [Ralstonia solanacearum]
MAGDSGAWVDEEFEGLYLGDPRRDRRAKELLKRSRLLDRLQPRGRQLRTTSV